MVTPHGLPFFCQNAVCFLFCLKLNVFHWHITDTHSLPIEFETSPLDQMAQYGAYEGNKVYKKAEIKDFVEYAMKRGKKGKKIFFFPGLC